MSSKRRLRRRKCGEKKRYTDQAQAITAAVLVHRQFGGEKMTPYRCAFCKQWHIGHHHIAGRIP